MTNMHMLTPLNQQQPILAFGDSLTFGYGALKYQSYPAQLASLINHSIINEGVNGELSAIGRQRLPALLREYKPQLLLLCHGANDILQEMSLVKMADNLRAMITMAQQQNIQVVLMAVPQVYKNLSPVTQYQQVSKDKNILLENNMMADLLSDPSLHSDIIHPNALGYQKIAIRLASLLTKHGAFSPQ